MNALYVAVCLEICLPCFPFFCWLLVFKGSATGVFLLLQVLFAERSKGIKVSAKLPYVDKERARQREEKALQVSSGVSCRRQRLAAVRAVTASA